MLLSASQVQFGSWMAEGYRFDPRFCLRLVLPLGASRIDESPKTSDHPLYSFVF